MTIKYPLVLNAAGTGIQELQIGDTLAVTQAEVGLSNVDNTSDTAKPISTATANALSLKAPLASPIFTGTVSGITASMIGLSNVTNVTQLPYTQTLTIIGDVSAPTTNLSSGSITTTLATITDTGTGSFKKFTSNTKGLITGTTPVMLSDITGLLSAGSISNTMLANSSVANLSNTNTGDETATTIKNKLGIITLSGSNTGDQTTITGNSGTTTKLLTARNINSVSFDGTADIIINAVDSTARVASSLIGAVNGVAPLGADSKISSTYLPSYVDDVLEGATLAAFPVIGEIGKIYVALDTNKTYRWSGTVYIYITSGAVDSVAGKTGIISLVKADIGLSNVDNTSDINKPVSTAQATADTAILNTSKSYTDTSITTLGINSSSNLGAFAATTSLQLASTISDETGIGKLVFNTSPSLITPILGTPTSGTLTNCDGTAINLVAGNATKLATARTINSVSFDGSANITITDSGKLALSGGTLTGTLNITPIGNASIALGRVDSVSSTPFIDFHSGAVVTTYDSRISSSGGTGIAGKGSLQFTADLSNFSGSIIGTQVTSTISTGTSPFIVTSTTPVNNLSIGGNAATVTTNANLVGEVTSIGNTTTLTNSSVISKVLTSFTSSSGVVSSTDSILTAIQKINGNIIASSSGTVTGITVVTANGFSGSVTGSTIPAITLGTSVTGIAKGNGTGLLPATSGVDYSAGTSILSTGILKSTATTGNLTIAIASDFPILNQSTTGTATKATNLSGGLAGQISYQSNVDTSSYIVAGTSGQILESKGTIAPSWVNYPTNIKLSGDVTSSGTGNTTIITNSSVITKVLSNWVSGSGSISATDSILSALQKLDGNINGTINGGTY